MFFKFRSIPTCVGFTENENQSLKLAAVHPHVRGVYGQGGGAAVAQVRSIPTCVGFTYLYFLQ